jgi:diaminopropionate ammonia-lyase
MFTKDAENRIAIKWIENAVPVTKNRKTLSLMDVTEIEKAYAFHKSFPQYAETPLWRLNSLAKKLNIKGFYVKDESFRFGLNSFKALGGVYAIARYIAKQLGKDISEMDYACLTSYETGKALGDITFYTATDGNHGRGVAWAAKQLRRKSVIFMPAGTSSERLQHILDEGADARITDLNYDDAVRLANEKAAADFNGVMIQDTAYEGYEEIPAWIMQGYGTLAVEVCRQLKSYGIEVPTHLFLQAGVGSFAGAIQGFFANVFENNCPVTTVVEASAADCFFRSVKANRLVATGGDLKTIMAGLACGEGNPLAWEILRNHSRFFVSSPDWVAVKGMRQLGIPLPGDTRIISGESGAVTTGLVTEIISNNDYCDFVKALNLNKDSVVLVFNTEGDTDSGNYRRIIL